MSKGRHDVVLYSFNLKAFRNDGIVFWVCVLTTVFFHFTHVLRLSGFLSQPVLETLSSTLKCDLILYLNFNHF